MTWGKMVDWGEGAGEEKGVGEEGRDDIAYDAGG